MLSFCSTQICGEFLLSLFHLCQAKIPDIDKCLDIVATLQAKKGSGEVCSSAMFFFKFQLKASPLFFMCILSGS